MNNFWKRFQRGIFLESKYLIKKIRLYRFFLLIISLVQVIVISLGDVQAFFLSNDSIVPKEWTFFKNPTNARVISIMFVIIIYLVIWIADTIQNSKETSELTLAIKKYTVPCTEKELKNLINRKCRQKYNISEDVRASIFLPVRIGFLQWRLQMVCRTDNIMEKELDAIFAFNEGVLGYTFLRAKNYHVEFLDVSNPQNLPGTYVTLSQDNRSLIDPNIKAVTVFAISQGNSIIGLLGLDTTNSSDLPNIQKPDLHSEVINWIRSKKPELEMLWRMKNNV